jgi:hypothetical protein
VDAKTALTPRIYGSVMTMTNDCVNCIRFWNCAKAARIYQESQEIAPGKSRGARMERRAYMLVKVRDCEEYRRIRQLAHILQPAMAEV